MTLRFSFFVVSFILFFYSRGFSLARFTRRCTRISRKPRLQRPAGQEKEDKTEATNVQPIEPNARFFHFPYVCVVPAPIFTLTFPRDESTRTKKKLLHLWSTIIHNVWHRWKFISFVVKKVANNQINDIKWNPKDFNFLQNFFDNVNFTERIFHCHANGASVFFFFLFSLYKQWGKNYFPT